MIEEEAVVARIEDGRVWVKKARQSGCSACKQTCIGGAVDDVLGKPTVTLPVSSLIALRVGDRVLIGIAEDVLIKGSMGVYMLPLAGLLAGAVLGKVASPFLVLMGPDAASACGGLIGLLLALGVLRYSPVISRNVPEPVVLRKVF